MKRRKSLVLLTGGLGGTFASCGSEWHLPGENITMPSSIDVGPGPERTSGDAKSADASASERKLVVPATIPVFAHYVSWHTVPGGWVNASVQPIFRDAGAELGYTSESEPAIRHHNTEMSANGVLPMISWWARDTYSGDQFLKFYLSIPGPQVAILYEAVGPGRLKVSGSASGVRMAQAFGPPTGNFARSPQVSRHARTRRISGYSSRTWNTCNPNSSASIRTGSTASTDVPLCSSG